MTKNANECNWLILECLPVLPTASPGTNQPPHCRKNFVFASCQSKSKHPNCGHRTLGNLRSICCRRPCPVVAVSRLWNRYRFFRRSRLRRRSQYRNSERYPCRQARRTGAEAAFRRPNAARLQATRPLISGASTSRQTSSSFRFLASLMSLKFRVQRAPVRGPIWLGAVRMRSDCAPGLHRRWRISPRRSRERWPRDRASTAERSSSEPAARARA